MKKISKFVVLLMVSLVGIFCFTACGTSSSDANDTASDTTVSEPAASEDTGEAVSQTLQKFRDQGYITIGASGTAPFSYIDVDSGDLEGIDGEITIAIAKKLGINEVKMKQTEFSSLLLGLDNGDFDVISSAMYITEERQKQALFSNVYYKEGEAIVYDADSDYEKLDDFTGKSIGVESGTGYVDVAENYKDQGIFKEVQTYTSLDDSLLALTTGKIDAMMADNVALAYQLLENKDLGVELLSNYEMQYSGNIGAAFPLDEKDFVAEWNEALDELKEDGTVLSIMEKYGLNEDYFVSAEDGQTVNP